MDIQHVTVNYEKILMNLVVGYFKKSYQEGKIPFPCAVCNPHLKLKRLAELVDQLDFAYIATVHYVQIIDIEGFIFVNSGNDKEKDQFFFLWGLSQPILKRVLFPLLELHKSEVRAMVAEISYGFMAKKPENMGICFINSHNYRDFL